MSDGTASIGWLEDWLADDPPWEQRLLGALLSRRLFGSGGDPQRLPTNMVTARAARAALPGLDWRRWLKRSPAIGRFAPPQRQYVPDSGWRTAGAIAWGDGRFLHALATGIRRRLRMTGSPLDAPQGVVRPAPETFWLLCAALPGGRSRQPSSARLADLALRLADRPGWAGVWEQWLIAEAILATESEPRTDARRLLAQLPIFDRPAYRVLRGSLGAADSVGATIAAEGWDEALPTCLRHRLRTTSTSSLKADRHV